MRSSLKRTIKTAINAGRYSTGSTYIANKQTLAVFWVDGESLLGVDIEDDAIFCPDRFFDPWVRVEMTVNLGLVTQR